MFDEVLEPGERIKAIRERLKVSQDKITKRFNKSQISKVENGSSVTLDLAREVVECAKEIGQRKGIEIDITVEKLMKSKDVQIIEAVNDCFERLKKIDNIDEFENTLSELEIFMQKYLPEKEMDLRYKIFKLAVDTLFKYKRFNNCRTYILKCIDLAFMLNKSNLIAEAVLILTRVYSFLEEFESIIVWGKYILSTNYASNETLKRIYFNVARAHRNLGKINDCIKLLEQLEQKFKTTQSEKIQVKILLANCYRDLKKYSEAEKVYLDILKYKNEALCNALAYSNLAIIYYLKKDANNALKYIDLALKIIKENEDVMDNDFKYTAYYDALLIYSKHNEKFDNVKKAFEEALREAENVEDIKMQVKIYKIMLKYCIKVQNDDYILKLVSLIKKNSILLKNKEIVNLFYMASHYFKFKDNKKFDMLFNEIFNLINLFEEEKYK